MFPLGARNETVFKPRTGRAGPWTHGMTRRAPPHPAVVTAEPRPGLRLPDHQRPVPVTRQPPGRAKTQRQPRNVLTRAGRPYELFLRADRPLEIAKPSAEGRPSQSCAARGSVISHVTRRSDRTLADRVPHRDRDRVSTRSSREFEPQPWV